MILLLISIPLTYTSETTIHVQAEPLKTNETSTILYAALKRKKSESEVSQRIKNKQFKTYQDKDYYANKELQCSSMKDYFMLKPENESLIDAIKSSVKWNLLQEQTEALDLSKKQATTDFKTAYNNIEEPVTLFMNKEIEKKHANNQFEYLHNLVASTSEPNINGRQILMNLIKQEHPSKFLDSLYVVYANSKNSQCVKKAGNFDFLDVIKIFIEYFCNMKVDNDICKSLLSESNLSQRLNEFVLHNTRYIQCLYEMEKHKETEYLCNEIDRIFYGLNSEKDPMNSTIMYRHYMKLDRKIKNIKIEPVFLQYYVIRLIEKIPCVIERLILTNQLIYMVRRGITSGKEKKKFIKFMFYLYRYYHEKSIQKNNKKSFIEKVRDLIQCLITGKYSTILFEGRMCSYVPDINNNGLMEDVSADHKLIVYGLMCPFFFCHKGISTNIQIRNATDEEHTEKVKCIFKYCALLNAYVFLNIPRLCK